MKANNTAVPRETRIVERILRYLRTLPRCYAQKNHTDPYGRAGEPDIDGCIEGRCFKLEVKRPGRKATSLQQNILERWRRAGALTGVVSSPEEVDQLFKGAGYATTRTLTDHQDLAGDKAGDRDGARPLADQGLHNLA